MDYKYDPHNPWSNDANAQNNLTNNPNSPTRTTSMSSEKNPFFDDMYFISNANEPKKYALYKFSFD
jgi:hypothetical protein